MIVPDVDREDQLRLFRIVPDRPGTDPEIDPTDHVLQVFEDGRIDIRTPAAT